MSERNSERSKNEILNAAETEFSEKGFYGARVDEIAASAGINKRMIYAYFGNKEGLYKQVLSGVYARMETVERKIINCGYHGEKLIREIVGAYFDFLSHDHRFVNILLWENLNHGKYLNQLENERIKRDTIKYFVDEIEKGKRDGVFKKDVNSWHTVLSLITICFANFSNQYTLSKLFGKDLAQSDVIAERRNYTADMVVSYLCGK